ncbi:Uncharacterized membrane-anchored protein [Palleronia salina]|uniref:Uncharacterized membrane-anchored protein n=2 Tax=Palleronia TaxID=315422 RepID=A0A1M6I486_9RHOB|nr:MULTISPECIES: DUF3422 domain-containing protein [Palleronia]SEM65863.1 Uncharacterized membrane-anchored protein [Palleronia pelagia]SHJ29277.1 Uncharacterized membrane-anchored protein [Palleronia salina]
MASINDHPLRYALANELHARPFPSLSAPCFAAYLAIKAPENAAGRDRTADRDHLVALLDRFGAQHPKADATHWFGQIGRYELKWEQHTEFVTYTIFGDGVAEKPFDSGIFDVFPNDWLADAPGARITSALIRVEERPDDDTVRDRLAKWFVPESLAASEVLDRSALIASDFRIDTTGHMRMAVFTKPDIGNRRVGRIVQRLCEIETYKTMSMLGLARVRSLSAKLGQLDRDLTRLMDDMTGDNARPEATLKALLGVSAELETILAQTSFRFGATGAYEALVNQRVKVLREEAFEGRQTIGEFMMRRFDPAMRTVTATRGRLQEMSERALRAGELLRTRVDVERSAQNQDLLESMDRRADLQLRLQRTVEGLSVVAISYYALNLVLYVAAPIFAAIGVSKAIGTAILVPLVVLAVWALVRRIRNAIE